MQMDIKEVKLEIYVPEEYVAKIRDDLAERGIGKVGNYNHVVAYQESKGFGNLLRRQTLSGRKRRTVQWNGSKDGSALSD